MDGVTPRNSPFFPVSGIPRPENPRPPYKGGGFRGKISGTWLPLLDSRESHTNDQHTSAHPNTTTWRAVRDAYHDHHHACPVCIAAGKGYGLRCGTGASLWGAYSANDWPGYRD